MADLRASGLGGVPKGTTADRPASPSIGDVFYNGDLGRFEIYTSNGWMAIASSPKPATSVTATNQGTNRAFNNGQASVQFTLSESGGFPTSYTVTSSPGSYTSSGTSSPIIVTGLQSNTAYTYTVVSTNDYGTSSSSPASSAVTATTVPDSPSAPTTTNSSGTAYDSAPSQAVSWSSPSNGGSSIIDYTVTRQGGSSQTVVGTSATFTGLTSGTSYTYTVTARNANGSSSESSQSSSVVAATVPQAPTIGTPTLAASTAVSVPFTANNTGNSAITSYTVTSSPGNITASGASSPIIVSGLNGNTTYTFTVTATNAVGTSLSSSASSSISTLSSTVTVDYLVVAGGGGGNRAPSNNPAGGGGAGGYRTSIGGTALVLNPATAYTISIGAGGAGSTTGTTIAGKGGNSTFHTITSTGGGGGAYEGINGAAGGSGGGDASGTTDPGAGNQGGYSPVEGYAGGQASGDGGGGGGGAGGAAPAAPSSSSNGLGGIGSNSASAWATITSSGANGGYYAGGGGGGSYIAGNNTGTGGLGGGGDGKSRFGSAGGGAGVVNTGGGGGGAGGNFSENPGNAGPGGNGGSGIVILKYNSFYTPNFNGVTHTTYTDGGFKYTKITAGTGTVTF